MMDFPVNTSADSSNTEKRAKVTKVMRPGMLLVLLAALATMAAGQAATPAAHPAVELYRQLSSVTLDPNQTYAVREATLQREEIHLVLEEGTISFSRAVNGRITGAFFEGDGEILLVPPNQVERGTLAQFTKSAVLTERFSAAYLRFNEDLVKELQPALRPTQNTAAFVDRWQGAARSLALTDALRISLAMLNQAPDDRFLHARLIGRSLGTFDVFFDSRAAEQISVAQAGTAANGSRYYDVWTTFAARSARRPGGVDREAQEIFHIEHTKVRATITPPHELSAEAEVTFRPRGAGERMFIFELSRSLQVKAVTLEPAQATPGAAGTPVEFIQNEALEGSELARRGNDLVAVVLPRPAALGETLRLRFVYAGPVISDAGGGLMYVGARGIWYPNRGPAMGQFDLEFRYPSVWTLVATGRRISQSATGTEQTSRWVSQRPMPLAGFNLGQYVTNAIEVAQETKKIPVEIYAARGVEVALQPPPSRPPVMPGPGRRDRFPAGTLSLPPAMPSPAGSIKSLAQRAAETLEYLNKRLGPYPYSSLAITQNPGTNSQGWPSLIFLSSYAFLVESAPEKFDELNRILFSDVVPAHEIAHQWWGDAVLWDSYRDQWLVEALANYYVLTQLEAVNPAAFATVMEHYREIQLREAGNHRPYREAGPVSLGVRLASSKFPDAYEFVTYGRGTWLIHMLRSMLRDANAMPRARGARRAAKTTPQLMGDELFFGVLRGLHQRLQGKSISTRDLQKAFEEALPENLRFEGEKSLNWFFENWVHSTAMPHLELKGVAFTAKGNATVASGKLLQEDAPETLITSVPIYASTATGQLVLVARMFADGPETAFRFHVPAGTRKLVIDPHRTVLSRP